MRVDGIDEEHVAGGNNLAGGLKFPDGKESKTLEDCALISETLDALIKAILTTSEQLTMLSLNLALRNEEFISHLHDGIVRYLYAAVLLSLVGKDINEKSIAGVIKSLDIKPDQKFIDTLLSTNIGGHPVFISTLAYVYAYYYLLANGVDISEQKIMNLVEAMDIKADVRTAVEIFQLCSNTLELPKDLADVAKNFKIG